MEVLKVARMKAPESPDLDSFHKYLMSVLGGLTELRFEMASFAEQLRPQVEEDVGDAELGSILLKQAMADQLDPFLHSLATLAGGPKAVVLQCVLDLGKIKRRLLEAMEGVPPSSLEAAVVAGVYEADPPAELRLAVHSVVVTQLSEATDLLLVATGLRP
jgi:hypothetical protein